MSAAVESIIFVYCIPLVRIAVKNNTRNGLLLLVCPDPVDKYLEETSVRYISPRGTVQSKDTVPYRRTGG